VALRGRNASTEPTVLLSVAIVDDIRAIGVIAIFYSAPNNPLSLAIAAAGLLVAVGLRLLVGS
jgi:Na+/H+ antiporter NhaA